MKITLKNFGCWSDKTFEFQDTGMNLLTGTSGTGKTTVLRALLFALYGVGRKVVSEGSTKCHVELTFDNLVIVREKGPCRLLVHKDSITYEDDEAQGVIRQVFGDQNLLCLEQNGRNTFIGMTPQQKLEYIETLAFQSFDIKAFKDRLKDIMKKSETEISRISITHEQLEKQVITVPELPSDTMGLMKECEQRGVRVMVQEHKDEYETTSCHIQELSNKLETERTAVIQLNEKKTRLQSEIKHTLESINVYSQKIDSIDLPDSRTVENIEMLIQNDEKLLKLDAVKARLNEYNETIQQLDDAYTEQRLRDSKEELEAIPFTRKTLRKMIERVGIENKLEALPKTDDNELKELEAQRQKLETTISNHKKVHKCPQCDTKLSMIDDTLVLSDTHTVSSHRLRAMKTELKELTQQISQLSLDQQKYKEYSAQLKEYKGYETDMNVEQLEEISENISKLKNDIQTLGRTVEATQQRLQKVLEKRQLYQDKYDRLSTECSGIQRHTEEEVKQYKEYIQQYNDAKRIIAEYTPLHDNACEKSTILKSKLEDVERKIESNDNLQTLQTQLENATEHKDLIYSKLNCLYSLQEYFDAIHRKNDLELELKKLDKELKAQQDKHGDYIRFKKLIDKAESMAIQAMIDTLNNNAQVYLEAFFRDEPLIAKITSVKGKDTKKEKQQIGMEIVSRGIVMDTTMLSGGEYDRVVLAFMLGICDIVKPPLLLLDECISSLDQDNAENVCEYLHKNRLNRCLVLIAHQIISGMFDKIIHTVEE